MTESPRSPAAPSSRAWWTALGALVALAIAFFVDVLFGRRTFFLLDVLTEEIPNHAWLHQNGWAAWNPLLFTGQAHLGNPQAYAFDVLHVLSLPLPALFGFNVFIVSHYVVSAVGCLGFLRAQKASVEAACFGAIAWTFGGFLISAGHLPTVLNTTTWLPWMLWFWPLAASKGARPRDRALAALVTAASLLGGEPQFWAMNVTLSGALVLATPGNRKLALVRITEVIGFALGLACIQLVPFWEYLGQSDRTGAFTLEDEARWSLSPSTLWSLFVPHHFPASENDGFGVGFWEDKLPYLHSIYPGLEVIALALTGLVLLRDHRWRWAIAFIFLGVSLAPGPSSALFTSAFTVLPPMARFRFPEKYWLLAAMPLAALAAGAFDAALQRVTMRQFRFAFAACAALLLAFGIAFPLLDSPAADSTPSFARSHLPEALATALVLLTVATAAASWLKSRRAVAWVWVAILAADLLIAHRHVNPTLPVASWARTPPAVEWLAAHAPNARILTLQSREPGDQLLSRDEPLERFFLRQRLQLGAPTAMEFGLNDIFAAYSLAPAARRQWLDAFERNPSAALEEAAVDYVVAPYAFAVPGLERVFEREFPEFGASTFIYKNAASPGRVRFDPRASGRVTHFERTHTTMRAEVDAAQAATLIVAESHHPDWTAAVDSREVPVAKTASNFLSVALPAGTHVVEFRFASRALRLGATLSLAALLALLVRTWLSARVRGPALESLQKNPSP